MKLTLIAVSISAMLMGCSNANHSANQTPATMKTSITSNQLQEMNLSYPKTQKGDVIDTYFGKQVADPYRWLEDDMSSETEQWVKAENAVTQAYLAQVPSRDKLKERLKVLLDYEKVGAPFKEGKYTYFFKNDGLQNQAVLYRQLDDGEAQVFLDPNSFSDDGTTSLASIDFSKDGSLVTYLISEGGSDWRKAITIDVETMQPVSETLKDIKFSGISWLGNEGFYYSSYDKPEGSELSAKTDQHKLYFHRLNDKQTQDTLVFGGTDEQKNRYVSGQVTEDNRYLLISAAVSTSGNKLYLKDLSEPDSPLVTILENTDSDTNLLDNEGSTLLFVTNLDAPNKRVVSVDAGQPQPENWQDFIAQTDNVLDVSTGGGYIFASYMVDAISNVKQLDMSGKLVREIALPGVGTASGFDGKKDQQTLYYSFTNYKTPSTIFSLNVESGESSVYLKSKANFDSDAYESKQVFYTSKDGTKVPMIITHKKGLKLDGTNPTMLYGYGGFNISLQPAFSSVNAAWLEQGGVYAVPNLRGGGEYGKAWHDAGTKLQKQNVFDDFIAAAEYLIEQNYTSPDYLAIRGGSNGGLLVGATMLQRPDLFKVALPAVGVLDMLRYHTFTAGAGWAYDYGTSEDSQEMFDYLMTYSPVQNVREGVNYPATLITTGDHDDRVVPAHSFKFAAQLQAKNTGPNPMLIRIETNAGHGAGTPISKTIEQYADIFGFTLYNMGIKVQ
ncbi:prolyl oligopeptidase, Serine peptidase, MEROPS family S09A [Paraglaciecola sp. T6c]|uniref:prolyl oligopeptidase family serine peptidase n=1 Tax=Pseudoalteromonas atlantica (strain T6c / ATCC BAA-1087) TaxID=3042615 RepID=UPI00005C5186|nr:prolyl oligopeptidase family serine peptidase [Paraglaciecola sp. T6c]ABG41293.1 prolyl oligopeptidase, Serine peptidase, MEROPS family S09A [Paraglaciecola sp. T6c]